MIKDNRPKTIEEINMKLSDKQLSPNERKVLLDRKKRLLEKQKKQLQKEQIKNQKPEVISAKRRQQRKERLLKIQKDKKNISSPIKKLTFDELKLRTNKMLNSSTLSVYASRLAHWISKGWGESEVPLEQVPSNEFFNSINKTYTRNAVKMPIAIIGWGEVMPIGWLDHIRDDLMTLEYSYNTSQNENLRISLNEIYDAEYTDLSFSRSKPLQNDYKRIVNEISGKGYDDYAIETYDWLQDMDTGEDSLWNTRYFLELIVSGGPSGKTAELLRNAYEELIKELSVLQLKSKDMYLTIQSYYDSFSPLGHNHKKGSGSSLHKKFVPVLRSGRMIASTNSLHEGNISDLKGVPVGIDVNSGRPIFIDYTDNSLPPSTIITASTGSGKTYLTQSILDAFLLFSDKYFPVVVDYKNEYVELGRSSGMQIISNSPSDGLYYDTMELADPTGDNDVDLRALDNSIDTTNNVFAILLGDQWEHLKPAFEYTRRSLYQRQGVYLDKPETWKNSKGLTYHTFYNEIYKILSEDRIKAEEETDIQDFIDLRRALSEYFEIDGSKTSYFKKPIRMKDIDNSRGIIFALDRKGETNSSATDTKLLLSMQFITHILSNLTDRKKDKRLIPIFWEETNQLLLIQNVANMISSLTSGGRSRGIRNFFITNAPGQIFNAEKESEFSVVDPGLISTIMNNVQSVIVGPNSREEMNIIQKKYNMTSSTMNVFFDLLVDQANRDNSDKSGLANKFILKHRGHSALIQAVSNQALNDLGVFGTETDINKENDEQKKEALMKELMKTQDELDNNDSIILNKDRDQIMNSVNDAGKNKDFQAIINDNKIKIKKDDHKQNPVKNNNVQKQKEKPNSSSGKLGGLN